MKFSNKALPFFVTVIASLSLVVIVCHVDLVQLFRLQYNEKMSKMHMKTNEKMSKMPTKSKETQEFPNSTTKELKIMPTFKVKKVLSINMVIIPFFDYDTRDQKLLTARKHEYKYVLQKNLAHPLMQFIYVLTTNTSQTSEIYEDLIYHDKVIVHELPSLYDTRAPFEFISQKLLSKDVLFNNADVYLGEGFENVDPAVMDEQNIFYSISRHAAPESKCQLRGKCTPYGGSHDAFLFRLHRPLPEAFFQDLKFPFCASGMENVLNWLFESQLQMCVLNPCRSLYIYHYHCSKLRMLKPRQRVNNRPEFRNRGIPPPTKKLVCQKVAAQMD